MAENSKKQAVVEETEAQANFRNEQETAERVKQRNELLAQRAARYASGTAAPMSYDEIRAARAEVINRKVEILAPEVARLDEQTSPINNPIPVRHDGEEPGEPGKGEDPDLVKIRPDVQDHLRQPPGHRVDEALQLHGETGDGGVPPEESRNVQAVQMGRDPEGKAKGLKEIEGGYLVDSEGDENLDQPEGHKPQEAERVGDAEAPEINIDQKREEYKMATGQPANKRWSVEHLQKLIDEAAEERQKGGE